MGSSICSGSGETGKEKNGNHKYRLVRSDDVRVFLGRRLCSREGEGLVGQVLPVTSDKTYKVDDRG